MATTLAAVAAKSAGGHDSTVAKAVNALPHIHTNVSSVERWLCLAGGTALCTVGVSGRGPGVGSLLAGGYLLFRAATGHCPVSQTLGFSMSDATAEGSAIAAGHGTVVEHAVTINKPAEEVYAYWRNFENLPRFMEHLLEVRKTGEGRSHWVARGPLGTHVEWDAEVVRHVENRLISWRSLEGSDVDTAGSVHFDTLPGGRGTVVKVHLKYDPPAGKVGTAVAKLFGQAPEQQIRVDLRRLKQLLEAGEVPTVEGQPSGRR